MILCFCTCDERDEIKTIIEKFMVLKAPSYLWIFYGNRTLKNTQMMVI